MKTTEIVRNSNIWELRWPYSEFVEKLLEPMPEGRVLEIGCKDAQVVPGSDGLDIMRWDWSLTNHPTFVEWDIRKSPWPKADKEYDLVLALEVWEHLYEREVEAFRELKRITRRAILSCPYMWKQSKHRNHVGLTYRKIRQWTDYCPMTVCEVVVPPPWPHLRHIVAMFEFH